MPVTESSASVARMGHLRILQPAQSPLPLAGTGPHVVVTVHVRCLTSRTRGREGSPGLVRRPGPRPAPLRRPGHISGVPSRPKHPAQPLARDVGSPHAALVTGKGYNSSHVTRSPHPTGPACSHDPCASKSCSGALASCAVRERQGARPVSRRRAARPTGPPIARSCGLRRHLSSCFSKYRCPPALQGAPSPPI
jgi:hypothetical protein